MKYSEHPPVCLVESVIKNNLEKTGKILPYKSAEKIVSDTDIKEYLTHEINMKMKYFNQQSGGSIEDLKKILDTPIEDIESALKKEKYK